jgi:hypothetical protein
VHWVSEWRRPFQTLVRGTYSIEEQAVKQGDLNCEITFRHPHPLARLLQADEGEAGRLHANRRRLDLRDQVRRGYRALALRGGSKTRFLSRNEKDLNVKFPEVKDSIAALDL